MAGLREIARACGVSTSTVSDILNRGREDRYRPETRERVLAAIRELGYQPDRTAQAMRSGRTRMIGFVAPNLTDEGRLENGGVYPFLVGLSHGLAPEGYHATLVQVEEIEPTEGGSGDEELPQALRERFFDALVLQYGLSDSAIKRTEGVGVPVLHWDSNLFAPTNHLQRDERAVTEELLERLIALGHRRIGYMVGTSRWERYSAGVHTDHYSYAERYETYVARMQALGEAPAPLLDYGPAVLGEQLQAIRLTAVIAPEADGARAAVDAALGMGWRVPGDLTVATLDREHITRQVGRIIGGMTYDRVATGRQAAAMLREILGSTGTVPSRRELLGEWTAGDTIGPAP